MVRRRGNDIISDHFLQKHSFRQGFLILLLNLTTNAIKHLHFCLKRFRFERRTWFVWNIFEMNGQFKSDPLISSLMLTCCLYTSNFKKQQDGSGMKHKFVDPFQWKQLCLWLNLSLNLVRLANVCIYFVNNKNMYSKIDS